MKLNEIFKSGGIWQGTLLRSGYLERAAHLQGCAGPIRPDWSPQIPASVALQSNHLGRVDARQRWIAHHAGRTCNALPAPQIRLPGQRVFPRSCCPPQNLPHHLFDGVLHRSWRIGAIGIFGQKFLANPKPHRPRDGILRESGRVQHNRLLPGN